MQVRSRGEGLVQREGGREKARLMMPCPSLSWGVPEGRFCSGGVKSKALLGNLVEVSGKLGPGGSRAQERGLG